jgi:hypothetical protein
LSLFVVSVFAPELLLWRRLAPRSLEPEPEMEPVLVLVELELELKLDLALEI